MTSYSETYDSDDALNHSPGLQPTKVKFTPEPSPLPFIPPQASSNQPGENVSTHSSKRSSRRSNWKKTRPSQSDAVLLSYLGPTYTDVARRGGERALNSASQSEASESDMEGDVQDDVSPAMEDNALNLAAEEAARHALQVLDASMETPLDSFVSVTKSPDSESHPEVQGGKLSQDHETPKSIRDGDRSSPHRDHLAATSQIKALDGTSLQETASNSVQASAHPAVGDTISPTLRDSMIPDSQGSPHQKLPGIHDNNSQNVSLPSLKYLAEAAEHSHSHSTFPNGAPSHRQSFSSTNGGSVQSPPQTSPGHNPQSIISPKQPPIQPNGISPPQYSESSPEQYRQIRELPSPPSQGSSGPNPYIFNRRPSQASENGPPYAPGTSMERHYPQPAIANGHQIPDGYIPNNTTPQSAPDGRFSIDGHHPLIQPQQRQQTTPTATVGFKCDFPGCPAPPFQTQYLLNSHQNVHSQVRPHYCPVKGCPRGVGGKGFKRKNEMIRHGLVHDSPGYVCPFCSDKEHKYPRPDNLQRHVRVHHIDKDKDDPLLRDVLAQRPEGGTRGRRRRVTNTQAGV